MVYKDRFVVSVKVGGRILREHDSDKVYLPFGSEYSILLKNLESRKAVVGIRIDGTDVLDGGGLIVEPKETVDLKRFIINGNFNEGPSFKFIEKTDKISDHRGDKLEDGIVEIDYTFEKERPKLPIHQVQFRNSNFLGHDTERSAFSSQVKGMRGNVYGGVLNDNVSYDSDPVATASASTGNEVVMDSLSHQETDNDRGITVPGQTSSQQFRVGHVGQLEDVSHTICLKLLGGIAPSIPVQQPLTIKTKVECKTCGTKNKSTHKCCSDCGTSLVW